MRKLFIFTLLATLFTACTQDIVVEVISPEPEEYIFATIEDETRVELNHNMKTVWTTGDMILRMGNKTLDGWRFNGKTGDRKGSFTRQVTFNGYIDYDFNNRYVAIYPYASSISYGTFSNGDLALATDFKTTQNYHPNSYDPTSNIMLGESNDGKNFTFRNVVGYLCLSLTGNNSVKSITIQGNNNEIIGGDIYINIENIDSFASGDELSYKKVLNCGDGVQLTDEPTLFYFTLLPTTFNKGINAKVTFTDGTEYVVNTSKKITIARNTIQPMANVNTGEEVAWQIVTLKHSGDHLTTPLMEDISGALTTAGYIYWGDTTQTEIKDIPNFYVYTDGAAEHTVTIKTMNAQRLHLESCSGISEIDLTNF